jgi:hypothetical protein
LEKALGPALGEPLVQELGEHLVRTQVESLGGYWVRAGQSWGRAWLLGEQLGPLLG